MVEKYWKDGMKNSKKEEPNAPNGMNKMVKDIPLLQNTIKPLVRNLKENFKRMKHETEIFWTQICRLKSSNLSDTSLLCGFLKKICLREREKKELFQSFEKKENTAGGVRERDSNRFVAFIICPLLKKISSEIKFLSLNILFSL